MPVDHGTNISVIEVICPGDPWDETVAFFTQKLGFRIDMIRPADDPDTMRLSGYGTQLLLVRGYSATPMLMIHCQNPEPIFGNSRQIEAPNGMLIRYTASDQMTLIPEFHQTEPQIHAPAFELTTPNANAAWVEGRAGMLYRDLIPSRQGGNFIASHIKIPQGGPVPDYVHYHQVRFQMIYCYKGWVRVVYEDQGSSFILEEGDCILQPPTIRHRVLECSSGLEVIEIGTPAVHETYVAHGFELPNSELNRDREFQGQKFVYHRAAEAKWLKWGSQSFQYRDTGIGAATDGLAGAQVVSARETGASDVFQHQSEFAFIYLLSGSMTLENGQDGKVYHLKKDAAAVLPSGYQHKLTESSENLQFLLATLPQHQ